MIKSIFFPIMKTKVQFPEATYQAKHPIHTCNPDFEGNGDRRIACNISEKNKSARCGERFYLKGLGGGQERTPDVRTLLASSFIYNNACVHTHTHTPYNYSNNNSKN